MKRREPQNEERGRQTKDQQRQERVKPRETHIEERERQMESRQQQERLRHHEELSKTSLVKMRGELKRDSGDQSQKQERGHRTGDHGKQRWPGVQ